MDKNKLTKYFDTIGDPYEQRCVVSKDGLYGYIDSVTERLVVDTIFQYACAFSNGRALVKQNNRFGFIDLNGNYIVKPIFDDAYGYAYGIANVVINNHYAYIDINGHYVTPFIYASTYDFTENIAYATTDDSYAGNIDSNGFIIIDKE